MYVTLYGNTTTKMIIYYYYIKQDFTLFNKLKDIVYNKPGAYIHYSKLSKEEINKLIYKFNNYCIVLKYPLFDNFEEFAKENIELPLKLDDFDSSPEWDPYEDI